MFLKYLFCCALLFSSKISGLSAENGSRVSIVTSIFKGDFFIKSFLEDIVQQTIFDQCELILINANSPGNEDLIIREYMERYPNIIYIHLAEDPGLYGVWNLGIKLSRAPYITNANLDDRYKHDSCEVFANYLDQHPGIGLVYSGCYITTVPNETFENNSSSGKVVYHSTVDFNPIKMLLDWYPFPNINPMWRKSIHAEYGLFDATFRSSGDMEMWLRMAYLGDIEFAHIPGMYGLFYHNGSGLSTKPDSKIFKEDDMIRDRYNFLRKQSFEHIERFLL